MKQDRSALNRRSFLGSIVVLPVLAGALSSQAVADGTKASKDSMHYQTSPNNGKQCSGCQFFIPGQDPKSDGTCKIVDGAISPNGYCMAYSAKS